MNKNISLQTEAFSYDNQIVKNFAMATIFWGIVGMLVGLVAAVQLFWPQLNLGVQYVTFGRIRPLHTNAVIFAFVGNAIFMGVYYSLQRLCKTRMYSGLLSKINFWGWQLIILFAVVTFALGYLTSKEYAELEWPIDIAITVVWVVFGINMLATLIKRREPHMYVAIWFYLATWVTVAILHIVNSLEIPVSLFKSYSLYAGVQDALVQWWYGHNAVAFFLTTPYLGLMYYFLPKAANRPVYSYRLSIIHFWSLIFIYIWAGPHHLLYTALPDWAQSLGTVFSIMLIAPSWGGMINGLLTLRGAWDKVREEPVLKFMVVAVTAYGMATFEGPMLSLKNVNAALHYTDWIIAHVHIGALGWNGFLTFGILYWLIPKLYRTDLFSKKLANVHFWLGTLGIVFVALSLYWAAVTQSLMWKQFTPLGVLQYPNFLETVLQIIPMYVIRAVGASAYFAGVIIMLLNLLRTMKKGNFLKDERAEFPSVLMHAANEKGHRWIESRPVQFTIAAAVAILIGGIVEFIPTFLVKSNIPTIASVKPLTALEQQGRDIYQREGCNNCHSQMIRPFRSETQRYGEYSKAGEFVYDHPFLWGSKRTGPDLQREGGKYSDQWHFYHMLNPSSMSPGSIMPSYPWLYTQSIDLKTTRPKIIALRKVGVPYVRGYEDTANDELISQANAIAKGLMASGAVVEPDKEIIALIAYLQRLGSDIKVTPAVNQ
ncbi:MAG: cytochrome-c oxidase, cbb3-type subunit I [Ignavibacteria bacterium]|nr:cytochrome-c oxidase, cbb3-type subunit I [Ignavibacteria bacterium]MCU7503577.1 cytochrome-c oxidase, cbb3-type subunit I [Ignavibacteria bacterium]MCU7516769.1 cytochrome-c oxidase, cbb3-type subunit I [Ignavibacteria bacterium]